MKQLLSAAKYSLLSFRRNPAATFFTVIFPMLFLVIFGFVFGNETVKSGAKVATFIVPGILGLSIVSATYMNLAMGQVVRREAGQLKRLRGTPMPVLSFLGGHILGALAIVVFMTILVTVVGRLFFGVVFNWNTFGVFVVAIAIGSFAFSALGLALTSIIPNEDAAPAIANATVFPLYFISDVFFFSDGDNSGLLNRLGDFFPIKPLVLSLQDSYDPFLESVTFPTSKLAVVAAWGLFGVVIAAKFFRWTPETERR